MASGIDLALPQHVVEIVARFVDAAELQQQNSLREEFPPKAFPRCTWLASMRLTSRTWRDAVDAVVPPPVVQFAALKRLSELVKQFCLDCGLQARMNAVWEPYGSAELTASVLDVPQEEKTCIRVLEYFAQLEWPAYAVYAVFGPIIAFGPFIDHRGQLVEEKFQPAIESLAVRRPVRPGVQLATVHDARRCLATPCPKDASCLSGLLCVWDAFGHCYGWGDSVEPFDDNVIAEWAELCERFPIFSFGASQIVATVSGMDGPIRADKSGVVVSLPLPCTGDSSATGRSCSVGCVVFRVTTD